MIKTGLDNVRAERNVKFYMGTKVIFIMKLIKLEKKYNILRAKLYTKLICGSTGHMGKHSIIHPPFHSNNLDGVFIGNNCEIFGGGWIDTFSKAPGLNKGRVEIGDNVYIGHRCHINSCNLIRIGVNVLIADGIFISDHSHGFEDIHTRILDQPLVCPGPVIIEDEVWLGERVCLMPNVTIGRHSVIGSNSVVTKNIPPHSVAVGSPAKVIKQYNHETQKWERI